MYVKNFMISDVISIFPEATLSLAFQTLYEANVKNLPVVKSGKLVGMVSEKILNEFSPSKSTSLSVYEINYVLSKTYVEEIMEKSIVTCTEDMLIEEVAMMMIEKDVHMVPVINENNTLIGIITRTDVINSFINIIGARTKGTRYTFSMVDKPGAFFDITQTTLKHNINITNVTVFDEKEDDVKEVVIKVDSINTTELEKDFSEKGYNILRIDVNN